MVFLSYLFLYLCLFCMDFSARASYSFVNYYNLYYLKMIWIEIVLMGISSETAIIGKYYSMKSYINKNTRVSIDKKTSYDLLELLD